MHLLSAFLLALSSNVDNFSVAIAYGIKKLKITSISNIVIAFISCSGTFFSMEMGEAVTKIIPGIITYYLGSIILFAIGLWNIIEPYVKNYYKHKNEGMDKIFYNYLISNPDEVDVDKSGNIDIKESLLLGISLTINNIGSGFGAGIAGLNIAITSLLTFTFSILTILLGYYLGEKVLSGLCEKWAQIISGMIIIFIGIYELIY